MTLTVFLSLLALSLIVIWHIFRQRDELRVYVLEHKDEYRQAIEEFNNLYNGERYVSSYLDGRWRNKYEYLYDEVQGYAGYFLSTEVKELIGDFKICFNSDNDDRKEFNEEYVENQKVLTKDLFDSLMDYPLDDQQRTAILNDEDNTLVIAGAGTGKTTTIMGKIAYILDKKLAAREEILLISFSKHAVSDMCEELSKIGIRDGITVQTFNAFGYGIIGDVEGNKPNLLFGGSADSDIKAKDVLAKALYDKKLDKKLRVMVANFFLYYVFPQPDVKSFDTLDEYYSYVKSIKLVTFQGEIVKSFEELKIANFLYLNNIEYQYERVFDEKIKSAKFTSYKPDFFLPQHNITIEHFGIDEKGRVPKFFTSDNGQDATKRYHEKMQYARNVHNKSNKILIESYSYEEMSGILLSNLKQNLEKPGYKCSSVHLMKYYRK